MYEKYIFIFLADFDFHVIFVKNHQYFGIF